MSLCRCLILTVLRCPPGRVNHCCLAAETQRHQRKQEGQVKYRRIRAIDKVSPGKKKGRTTLAAGGHHSEPMMTGPLHTAWDILQAGRDFPRMAPRGMQSLLLWFQAALPGSGKELPSLMQRQEERLPEVSVSCV